MGVVAEFNVSDFVRNPSQVIEKAEQGEVILHRRGRADLRLTMASLHTESATMNEFLARLLSGLMEKEVGREAIRDLIRRAYPWLRFLPDDAQDQCVTELLGVAVACASIGNFAALHAEEAAWRHTAEICSDPKLFAVLSGPAEIEDHGPVSIPGAP